jgi:muramoyltetrapeptide carboxypeptidase
MIKPRALESGDRVAIVAPASPFERDEFERGVDEVRRLGFEPVFDARVFDRERYVAGPAAGRAASIQSAWRDPSITAILAVRGGYGSAQLLPFLDRDEARRSRKAFVGYSDLTSLLTYLTTGCGVVCFHGPTVAGRLGGGDRSYDRDSFLRALTQAVPLGELAAPGVEPLRPGEASGPLFGGTLTQLVASMGTPYAFDPPRGCVLFIDEVDERPYRIDRMWVQLAFSGVLSKAAAVVFGELPGCDEPGGEPTARAVVADLVRDFPGPVLVGFPSGHTAGPALTLPLGVQVRVVGGPRSAVVVEEAAVEQALRRSP